MAAIQLDTTLADLYREHGIKGECIVTTHCVFGHLDLHPGFPRELVFPEDEEPVPYSDDEQEQERLRRIILGYKPLRRVFGVGDMDVIFFGPNVTAAQVERDLAQLPPNQRHRPRIVDLDSGDVPEKLREVTRDRTLVFWRPQGWMREVKCLVDPQLAYDINAKDYLVTSGIRTPPSEIVSLEDIGADSVFATRRLPFAVKLLRAGCSFGTYLVTNEERRKEMLAALVTYRERGTSTVILSEYIDLVLDLSVHFFIGAPDDERNRDNPLILGISVQTLTESGKWTGGYIDYQAQDTLRDLVWDTVVDTTRRMPEEFVGWAGVDIVVDAKGGQWVVDLNARFTGSMPICFMSGHFWKRRGLRLAQFATFEYSGELDGIYTYLSPLIESGQAVVTATATIGPDSNMADIAWGGKDEPDLARVGDIIRHKLPKS
ncbi:uncharacterized protein DNG_05642 [Cephalotrichum gorgonifer]|uniref:ATP-grasp domain-containing protein n=1 Tax=Cephalotrichum gorgonifer TaxID=2041049 RepID=A0AAE8MY95_9PEZI|nr:uncharacterized protein DNG_05642 [Cephalotrichum gorgonifer]